MRTREQILAKITLVVIQRGEITGIEKKLSKGIKRKLVKNAIKEGESIRDMDLSLSRVDHIDEINKEIDSLVEIIGEGARVYTDLDFDMKYTPNLVLKSENFADGRFETFGKDLEIVLATDEKFVWTCVDGDDGTYLTSGYHLINRIYYLITNEPWTEDEEYKID